MENWRSCLVLCTWHLWQIHVIAFRLVFMSQYSYAIRKYNDIGIKDQPIKSRRGRTPTNIYKCQIVQVMIKTRPIVRKNPTYYVINWFKGGVAIITMYRFTNVIGGKPQTQHNGNVLHHTRSVFQIKCNTNYGIMLESLE